MTLGETLYLFGGGFIWRSVWEGSVKTKKGYRVINIEPALVRRLVAHLGDRNEGVFETPDAAPLCKSNVRRKLHQLLKELNLTPGGLRAFRDGRVAFCRPVGVPGDLIKEWV
jgi:hypothetical protein